MTRSILIIGATGNTGQGAVRHVSAALATTSPETTIIALTRDANSPAAQALAQLPGVKVEPKNWTEIDAAWLRGHGVEKAYVAAAVTPALFNDESAFYLAARKAGVRYVVRVSTVCCWVRPDCPVFYGRAHWAVEQLLESSEFDGLGWTSLQPNFFGPMFLAGVAEWVDQFRQTGTQPGPLKIILHKHNPVALLHPSSVGTLGASLLLLLPKSSSPNSPPSRLILAGPHDVTGLSVLRAVEALIGQAVDAVEFQDESWMAGVYPPGMIAGARRALEVMWSGQAGRERAGNSPKVEQLGQPGNTMEEMLEAMVGDLTA